MADRPLCEWLVVWTNLEDVDSDYARADHGGSDEGRSSSAEE